MGHPQVMSPLAKYHRDSKLPLHSGAKEIVTDNQ